MSEQRSDREIILNRVAQNLRRARRLLGVSQETLGIRAGLHRSEIGMLENSERIPRIDTAVKLATALEIPVDQLVDGLTWEPPKPLGETGRFVADRPAGELRPIPPVNAAAVQPRQPAMTRRATKASAEPLTARRQIGTNSDDSTLPNHGTSTPDTL